MNAIPYLAMGILPKFIYVCMDHGIFFVFFIDAALKLLQLSSYPCSFRLLPRLPTSFEKHM